MQSGNMPVVLQPLPGNGPQVRPLSTLAAAAALVEPHDQEKHLKENQVISTLSGKIVYLQWKVIRLETALKEKTKEITEEQNLQTLLELESLRATKIEELNNLANYLHEKIVAFKVTDMAKTMYIKVINQKIEQASKLGEELHALCSINSERCEKLSLIQQTLEKHHVVDPGWEAACLRKIKQKSWTSQKSHETNDANKLNKEQWAELLSVSQYAEMVHFNCMLELNNEKQALRKDVLKVSEKLKNILEQKPENTEDVVANGNFVNVDYESITQVLEHTIREIRGLYPCEGHENFEKTAAAGEIVNNATLIITKKILLVEAFATQRISALSADVSRRNSDLTQCYKELKKLAEMVQKYEEDLTWMERYITYLKEKHRKQIAKMKSQSRAICKAVTSNPRVILEKLHLANINN